MRQARVDQGFTRYHLEHVSPLHLSAPLVSWLHAAFIQRAGYCHTSLELRARDPRASLHPKGSNGPTLGHMSLPGLIMCLRDGKFHGKADSMYHLIETSTESCREGEYPSQQEKELDRLKLNGKGQEKAFPTDAHLGILIQGTKF